MKLDTVEANRAFLQTLLKSHSALSSWLNFVVPYWDNEALVIDCPHQAIAQVFATHQSVLIFCLQDIVPAKTLKLTAPGIVPIGIKLNRSTTIKIINDFGAVNNDRSHD